MKRFFLLFWLLLPYHLTALQSVGIDHFTADDGLSQNLVFDIIQDHRGFLWIGTKDGLNRYDGYNFKTYRSDAYDARTLQSNYITHLHEDLEKNLWVVSSPGGLHLFEPAEDAFTRINEVASIPEGFEQTTVNDIVGSEATGWYLATSQGLAFLKSDISEIVKRNIPGVREGVKVVQFTSLSDSTAFVVTSNSGVFSLNLVNGALKRATIFDPYLDGREVRFLSYNADRDRNYHLIEDFKLSIIDRSGRLVSTHRIPLPGKRELLDFKSFTRISKNNFIINNVYDLWHYDLKTGSLEKVFDIPSVNDLYIDRSGIYWIGTSGYGLYKYDPKTARFGYDSRTYYQALAPDFKIELSRQFEPAETEYWNTIMDIFQESESVVWVLTRRYGLFRYELESKKLERHIIKIPSSGLTSSNALSMDRNPDGSFDILYRAVVVNYHPKRGVRELVSVKDLFPNFKYSSNLPIFELLTVLRSHSGYYWVGSVERGLAVYNSETGEILNFYYKADQENSLSSNHILSLSPDPKQPDRYMWAGTDGGGLNRIEIATGQVLRFSERDGLPNNVIYGIYADHSGYLWMSSNRGIIRFDPQTFEHLNFTQRDGLQSSEFNRREHYQFADGRIIFGGSFGSNLFDPNSIQLNQTAPELALTEVTVMNHSALPLNSDWFIKNTEVPTLSVNYDQKMLGFRFAALEFSAPSKNLYRYRFPPFIDEWTDMGTRREISFTNLDPGSYSLEVMGSNNDGIWTETPYQMNIQVLPPFWMTGWFRFLLVTSVLMVIGGTVWYLSRRKYRAEIRQLEYKMAIDQERMRISRDMHDDLGSRLTQIRMMTHFASENPSFTDQVRQQFSDISEESKGVIQKFSEIVWSLNPNNDTLDNLVNFMVQHADGFCQKTGVPCRIHADPTFPDIFINSSKRHNMLAAYKEALHNAVKYSKCRQIDISLTLDEHRFKVSVRDDGIGFEPDKTAGSGQGLASMASRMDSIGGTFDIDTKPGSGTDVTFQMLVSYHTKG